MFPDIFRLQSIKNVDSAKKSPDTAGSSFDFMRAIRHELFSKFFETEALAISYVVI
jgi:hypothetical protein